MAAKLTPAAPTLHQHFAGPGLRPRHVLDLEQFRSARRPAHQRPHLHSPLELAVPAFALGEARRAFLRFLPPRRQRQFHLAPDGGSLVAIEALVGRLPVRRHGDRRKARDLRRRASRPRRASCRAPPCAWRGRWRSPRRRRRRGRSAACRARGPGRRCAAGARSCRRSSARPSGARTRRTPPSRRRCGCRRTAPRPARRRRHGPRRRRSPASTAARATARRRCRPTGSSRCRQPSSLRSAPAQNAPPAPVSTATRASASASKAFRAAASPCAASLSSAFLDLRAIDDDRGDRAVALDQDFSVVSRPPCRPASRRGS